MMYLIIAWLLIVVVVSLLLVGKITKNSTEIIPNEEPERSKASKVIAIVLLVGAIVMALLSIYFQTSK